MPTTASQKFGGLAAGRGGAQRPGGDSRKGSGSARWFWLGQLARVYFRGRLHDLDGRSARAGRLDSRVILAALALNLLGLAMPLAVLQVYDRITANSAIETLAVLGVGLVCVALIEFSLRSAINYLLALDANRLGAQLHGTALERVLSERGERRSAADMQERFQALDTLTEFYAGEPRRNLIDLPFSLVFLGAIAMIGGVIVAVPLAIFGVFILASSVLLRRSHRITDEREQLSRRRADFLAEIFGGLQTLKGIGAEPLMLRRFERLAKGTAERFRDATKVSSDIQLASGFFNNLNVVAMISFGAVLVIDGQLTVGGLAACSLLSGRAVQPLIKAASALAELQRAMIAADTAKPLFAGGAGLPDAPSALDSGPAAVEARGLTIIRGGRALLDEARFSIRAGEICVFRGALGSGRSTVLRVVGGLESKDEGALLIDGVPIESFPREIGQSAIVTATQMPFHGTVMENLTLFGAGAEKRDALWAMRSLGADALIGRLPAGYDTVVGAGVSEAMSRALIRQIVMARAIAQRPRLLLLDEPHVYLDDDSERRLVETLVALRGQSTIIVVSDQPSLLAVADSAVELLEGFAMPLSREEALSRWALAS